MSNTYPPPVGLTSRRHRVRRAWRWPLIVFTLITGSARCSSDDITSGDTTSPRSYVDPPTAAVAPGEILATVQWNDIVGAAIGRNRPSQNAAWRQYAYITLAQHDAIESAAKNRGVTRAAMRGAVAGASASVLTYLFPNDATMFEVAVESDKASVPPGLRKQFAQAELEGREIGAKIVARAKADRFAAVWTGTVPAGPGTWSSLAVPAAPPLLPLLGHVQPFFLTSGSQFRPPPPPEFGSSAFLEGLNEVRRISDTRTSVQDSIAKFWAIPTGSLIVGYWNTLALELVQRYRLGERAAAHTLALMNMAGFDANIASHEAKYTYWLIRPSAADPAIKLAIGLPNHPSYPSNHAVISGTAANVLSHVFPAERERLGALANEAAMSRIYGGIHYRFDADAGVEMARKLAALALEVDARSGLTGLVP